MPELIRLPSTPRTRDGSVRLVGAGGAAVGSGDACAARRARPGAGCDCAVDRGQAPAPGVSQCLCGRSSCSWNQGEAGRRPVLCGARRDAQPSHGCLVVAPHPRSVRTDTRRGAGPTGVIERRVRSPPATGPGTRMAQAIARRPARPDAARHGRRGSASLSCAVPSPKLNICASSPLTTLQGCSAAAAPAAPRLRAALQCHRPELARTKSLMEERFVLLCERYSLTPPAVNVWIGRWQVDAVWFEHRVVVELDSRARARHPFPPRGGPSARPRATRRRLRRAALHVAATQGRAGAGDRRPSEARRQHRSGRRG